MKESHVVRQVAPDVPVAIELCSTGQMQADLMLMLWFCYMGLYIDQDTECSEMVPGPRTSAHRSCALGLDGDAGNVAEGWLREGDRCRAPGGVLRDREGVRRAGASQLVGQQAPRQVIDNIQYTACQTCSTQVQLLWAAAELGRLGCLRSCEKGCHAADTQKQQQLGLPAT
jgi:hypothetical protein